MVRSAGWKELFGSQAIANKAAVSTEDGQEVIITGAMAFPFCFCSLVLSRPCVIRLFCGGGVSSHGGDDIPSEFLENAKRIGEQALKILPQLCTPSGLNLGRGPAVRCRKVQGKEWHALLRLLGQSLQPMPVRAVVARTAHRHDADPH